MANKTVKSPAGRDIEIVDDDDWIASVGGTDNKTIRQWTGLKPAAIRELWLHGPAVNKSGQATRTLYERIIEANPHEELGTLQAMTPMLADRPNAPAFKRETNGKRTYTIELVAMPELWYAKLLDDLEPPVYRAIPIEPPPSANGIEPEVADEELERIIEEPEPERYAPPIELEIASQVAMSLLTTVVEIISAGSPSAIDGKVKQLTTELAAVSERLGSRLEENDRMRKQLREAGDEINALRHERNGLRERVRKTEANLAAALKGESLTAINHEITKRVDQIMRATPTAKGD
jgi:regulator of replication initiation timing